MSQFVAGVVTGAVGAGVIGLVAGELAQWRRMHRYRKQRLGYIEDWARREPQRRAGTRWQ